MPWGMHKWGEALEGRDMRNIVDTQCHGCGGGKWWQVGSKEVAQVRRNACPQESLERRHLTKSEEMPALK